MRQRETGRERYWRQVREIEGELDVPPSRARRLWSQYFGRDGAVRRPIRRLQLAVRAASDHSRCPFCRDDASVDDVECSRCHVRVHAECLEELDGRCPTLGCHAPGRVRARRRPRRPAEGWGMEQPTGIRLGPDPARDRLVPILLIAGLLATALVTGLLIWMFT